MTDLHALAAKLGPVPPLPSNGLFVLTSRAERAGDGIAEINGNDLLALIAEVVASRIAAEWQPIESAPKDGRDLLLWSEGDGRGIGQWLRTVWGKQGWSVGTDDNAPEDDYQLWVDPTHWRPLPEPLRIAAQRSEQP